MEPGRARGKPVFVDDSGRRCWIVRSVGRLLVAAAIAVVSLTAIVCTVSPTVAASTPRSHVVSASPVTFSSVAADP